MRLCGRNRSVLQIFEKLSRFSEEFDCGKIKAILFKGRNSVYLLQTEVAIMDDAMDVDEESRNGTENGTHRLF